MDELKSGSHADSADISKTFDTDERFDRVLHACKEAKTDRPQLITIGTRCRYCNQVITRRQE